MSLWRQLSRGLRVLTHRRSEDDDLSEELGHFAEQSTAEHMRNGMSPDDARRAARMELGNMTVAREQVRSYGWENVVSMALGDMRYAARRLRHNPGFTAVSVVTLALGIGATTAIFSAVNPILFQSLPYPHADRITMISDATADGQPLPITFGTYRELTQRSRSFEVMAPFEPWQPTIVGQAEPERLAGQRVGAGFFGALGVMPVLGRDFDADDDRAGGPNVVVLSDALWRRRFSADPAVIGRQVKLDADQYVVIGIMPSRFDNVVAPLAELWTPLQYRTAFGPDDREWGHHLQLVARLRPGVALDEARRDLNTIARTPRADFARVPWASLQRGLVVTSLQADVTNGIRPALLAVIGAVMLLLVIACVNVTNLLLARGAQRRGEFAVRTALGAARSRVIGQLLTESLALALLGGAVGFVVAEIGVRALVALSPPELPRLDAIQLNGGVFAFGLLLTTLIGVIVGVIPALNASRNSLRAGIDTGSRRTAGAHHRTRDTLVVVEVALALMLLVGAGLLLRSIEHVFAVPVGFDARGLLTMQVQETGDRFDSRVPRASIASTEDVARRRFFSDALDAVRGVPGVTAAAFTSLLPQSGATDSYGVHLAQAGVSKTGDGAALRYAVTPGYFAAMRIPLRRGRLLDTRDDQNAPRAAVINESFANREFPRRDPIGQRLQFGQDDGRPYTIVGIVGDVKQSSLEMDQPDAVYLPSTQWHWADDLMSLVVRTHGDPTSLTPAIRAAIWSVDKNQPIVRIATMDDLVGRSVADRHFALLLFEAFGLTALILAATGIYGVLSGGVTERIREIGVRSALGATPGDIVRLVLRRGAALTIGGIVFGIFGALLATRAVTSLLFGVSRVDPGTYAGVVALLGIVGLIAAALPADRAARVDPATTLRAE